MKINIIAAMDEKRGIGKDNKLPWHIPEDLKRFRQLTSGHPVIIGRKTYESIGRVLPNRTNIIITRDLNYKVEGAVVVHSLEEGIGVAKKNLNNVIASKAKQSQPEKIATSPVAPRNDEDEIFIIGGGQVFKEALEKNVVDRLYLTVVKGDYAADTFFPEYNKFKTKIHEEHYTNGEYDFTFLELKK